MATFGQTHSRPRDAYYSAATRLYKFALVLTVNEELARALLRSTLKGLNTRKEFSEEDRDFFMGAFRRMYALWSAKLAEEPDIQKRCLPEPRLFAPSLSRGQLAGNAHFAKFIANMPPQQRASLYLVYGEGASYDESADIAGLSMQGLMKHLARGHSALSSWLDHRGLSDGAGRIEPGLDSSPERERAA